MTLTPTPFEEEQMLALAGRAIGKIDLHGRRGTSMVTHEEVEAMAALVECLGAGPACQEAHLKLHAERLSAAQHAVRG